MAKTSETTAKKFSMRELLFSELALRGGRIPEETIRKGWSILEELSRFGINRTMSSVLLERKLIEKGAEREVVEGFKNLHVGCPSCRKRLTLEGIDPDSKLRCRTCQALLEVELKGPMPQWQGAFPGRLDGNLEQLIQFIEVSHGSGDSVASGGHAPGGHAAHGSSGGSGGPTHGPGAPPSRIVRGAAGYSLGDEAAPRHSRETKEAKEPKETKEAKEPRELREPQEPREAREKSKALTTALAEAKGPSEKAPGPAPDDAALAAPRRRRFDKQSVRRFQLQTIIATGPFGRAYRAAAAAGKSPPVVLKLLFPDLDVSPTAIAALQLRLREWSEAGGKTFSRPHAAEQEGPNSYVVRPHLGEQFVPLSSVRLSDLKEKPGLLRRIALSLKAVHASGKCHGNLKPSNIFIEKSGGQGQIVLVDPALHLVLPRENPLQRWRVLANMPRFVSPEEIAGGEPTAASDVYALGWIFFAVLSGTSPFEGVAAAEILNRHQEGPVPELPAEAGEWRHLVQAMTALQATERPPDAGAVLGAVETIIAGKKLSLAPTTGRKAAGEVVTAVSRRKAGGNWRYALGPVALLAVLGWTGWCYKNWRQSAEALSNEDRSKVLFGKLAEEAYWETAQRAKTTPEQGRELWEQYLRAFPATPMTGSAETQRAGFPAPIPERARER